MAYAKTGHLYIIKAEDGGIKIGISINPHGRIDGIEAASDRPIVRKFISPAMPDYDQLEKVLHAHFASSRVAGEWFSADFDAAVLEAHRLGAICHPDHWNKSVDYVQGAMHRKRLVAFTEVERTEKEMQAFLCGMGELARQQVEYAEQLDAQMTARAIGRLEQAMYDTIELEAELGIRRQPSPETMSALAEIASQIKQDLIDCARESAAEQS